jgi:hypothetical protein
MSEEPKPQALVVPLSLGQRELRFATVDDFKAWHQAERKFWQCLESASNGQQQQTVRQMWNAAQELWSEFDATIHRYEQGDESVKANEFQKLRTHLTQWSGKGVRLTSADPRAQYIAQLAAHNSQLAGHALLAFTDADIATSNSVRGLVLAELFTSGASKATLTSEQGALQSLRTRNQQLIRRGIQLLNDGRDELLKLSGLGNEKLESQTREFATVIDGGKSELANIAKTYDEALALKSPIDYWEAKEKRHWYLSRWFAGCFALLSVAVLGLLYVELKHWLIPEFEAAEEGTFRYWPGIVLLLSAGFLIWPLRLVARFLLSNVHLATDAAERAVLVKTYFALSRSGDGGLQDKDRQLILTSLFRAAATGVVSEDGSPSTPVDAMFRMLSGK